MKKITLLLLITLTSCTITKKVQLSPKTVIELSEFYKAHNVSNFFVVESRNSLVNLSKEDRLSIPQNIIFDANGYEIEHFDKKLCANHTLAFLKNFNEATIIKHSSYTIKDYLKHFKTNDTNLNIENIINSNKIRVFVNTAAYADKYKINKEAFEIYNQFHEKYEVYIINLDNLNE